MISNDYGNYELGCWITTKNRSLRGTIIRNICYYIPLLIGIIINFYLINKVRYYVNRALPDDPSNLFINRLKWYPYLLLLILVTYLLKVIVLLFTTNDTCLFIILVFTTFFSNLLGVYIFIIFGYTKSVKEIIVKKIKKVVGIESKRESEEIEESGKYDGNSNSQSNASEKVMIEEDEESKDDEYYRDMSN